MTLRLVQCISELRRKRRSACRLEMVFTIGPTITCLDDIAGMRRPHGRLVTKAVRPHLIDKVVFSAKIKEI